MENVKYNSFWWLKANNGKCQVCLWHD